MRESKVEALHREKIEATGGLSLKFVSPGVSGVPDRINLAPIPAEHQKIVAKYFWFTELKAPGEKPKPRQKRVHEQLTKLGYKVEVVDGI